MHISPLWRCQGESSSSLELTTVVVTVCTEVNEICNSCGSGTLRILKSLCHGTVCVSKASCLLISYIEKLLVGCGHFVYSIRSMLFTQFRLNLYTTDIRENRYCHYYNIVFVNPLRTGQFDVVLWGTLRCQIVNICTCTNSRQDK